MTHLIPCPPGWVAVFYVREDDRYFDMPILAWDDEGNPMVAADLALEPAKVAASARGAKFVSINQDPISNIVAVAPSEGWRIRYALDDGRTWTEPIIGWGVLADGDVRPLTTDRSGMVQETSCTDKCAVYHPDQDGEFQ